MSQLFSETNGAGQHVLVLHGWGMNSQVWQPVREALCAGSRVTFVDLPGHGRSGGELGSLAETVALLLPLLEQNASGSDHSGKTVIIGWSLGGLLAQALAQAAPDKVAGLVLIASTPKFVQSDTWEHALSEQVLAGFAENLQKDYAATVKRFFALQFMGVRSEPGAVKALQESIMQQPATVASLQAGLEILRTADFTATPVSLPALWLLGRLDKLIPVSLQQGLHDMGYAQTTVLRQCAHVPFVTHPEDFMASITPFLEQCRHEA